MSKNYLAQKASGNISQCKMTKGCKVKKTMQSTNHVSFGDLAKVEGERVAKKFSGRSVKITHDDGSCLI